jgi:DNA-binding transcriptional ArsR family regulator
MIIDPNADDRLDRAFMALGDPVRRRIIARLSRGPATVNELAEPFQITKQAVSKHIQVLEQAGLVTRTREAQRRPVHLDAAQLEALTAWIDRYRLIHEQQFRTLDSLLATERGTNAAPSVADSTTSTGRLDDPADTSDADASVGTSQKEPGQ